MATNVTNGIFGGNIALGKATLAAGTTTTISTTGTLPYAIQGQVYSRTALSNQALTSPTLDVSTGKAFLPIVADQACIILFALDASGNVRASQGPIVKLSEVTDKQSAVSFPSLPDNWTQFGYLYAQGGTTLSGTWTFGTNNLSSVTGMTYTFRDLTLIPAQPITA